MPVELYNASRFYDALKLVQRHKYTEASVHELLDLAKLETLEIQEVNSG